MSWQTNRIVMTARNAGRFLGLNSMLAALLGRGGYEERYDSAFSNRLRSGDCIWDVGANVGYYSTQFSQRVGSTGRVVAFEPSPVNFRKLRTACAGLANTATHQVALGRESAKLPFEQGTDDLGATSRIANENSDTVVIVEVRSGASIVADGLAGRPNAIKIDVEGWELEVLEGLGDLLADETLHTIGVEVHFGILEARGMSQAPASIESLLQKRGFRVDWPDASHIIASRRHA